MRFLSFHFRFITAVDQGKKMKKKNKVGGGLGGMVAAMMPGAEIDKKGRVLVNIATSRETLIFNIGGVNFETYRYVPGTCFKSRFFQWMKWATTWQNQQNECAPSEVSDQPEHAPSLIRVRYALNGYQRTQCFFMRAAKTLVRLGGCPGWSESSLDAQPFCWFCHVAAQMLLSGDQKSGNFLSAILGLSTCHKIK